MQSRHQAQRVGMCTISVWRSPLLTFYHAFLSQTETIEEQLLLLLLRERGFSVSQWEGSKETLITLGKQNMRFQPPHKQFSSLKF